MLTRLAIGFLNHLLAGEDWPRERLKAFTGQTVQVKLGEMVLRLEITADGLLAAGDPHETATVSITLPADAATRMLTDRASLLADAQISGSAELAECLGFISRNLRWDGESDLARLVGDIAARRLVAGSKQVFQWHQQQVSNLALNLAEYFTEENPSIARRQDVSAFCTEVDSLLDPLERVEKRIAALESTRT